MNINNLKLNTTIDTIELKLIAIHHSQNKTNKRSVYKSLFTDGNSYICILEWNVSLFKDFKANDQLILKNFMATAVAKNEYYIQMNDVDLDLTKTYASTVHKVSTDTIKIRLVSIEILDKLNVGSNKKLVSVKCIVTCLSDTTSQNTVKGNQRVVRFRAVDCDTKKHSINAVLWNCEVNFEELGVYELQNMIIKYNEGLQLSWGVYSSATLLKKLNKCINDTHIYDISKGTLDTVTGTISYWKDFESVAPNKVCEFMGTLMDCENKADKSITIKISDSENCIVYCNAWSLIDLKPFSVATTISNACDNLSTNFGKVFKFKMLVKCKRDSNGIEKRFYNVIGMCYYE